MRASSEDLQPINMRAMEVDEWPDRRCSFASWNKARWSSWRAFEIAPPGPPTCADSDGVDSVHARVPHRSDLQDR